MWAYQGVIVCYCSKFLLYITFEWAHTSTEWSAITIQKTAMATLISKRYIDMPHAKCDMAKMNTILDKVFKYGPSKIYGRWPLKILLGPFLNTLSRFKIFSLMST